MTKTNKKIKQRKEIVNNYLLNSISTDGYNMEVSTDQEKLLFVISNFKKEKEHDIKRYGVEKAFINHLQGLPSYINIDYEYYKIMEFVKNELGYVLTDKEGDKILSNWWEYMGTSFIKLCNKEKINFIEEVLKNE